MSDEPTRTARRAALRTALGRIGIWSFGLERHTVAEERSALGEYEAIGYRATWYPESLSSREAFAHAAVMLAGSGRMVVGSGIANIYARDPMAMANGAKTLADAFPGRFVLGIGVSHAPSVATRGSAYERPIERMTEYVDAMEGAAYAGPEPVEPPPLVLAALGPRMLELAAARADGAHPYFVPVEHTAFARQRLGPEPVLIVEQTGVLDTDRTRAREVARRFVARYVRMANYANNLRRLGWPEEDLAGEGSDRLVDTLVVQGDAAALAGRVREHLAAGADHVCVQLRGPDPGDLCVAGFRELRGELGDLFEAGRA